MTKLGHAQKVSRTCMVAAAVFTLLYTAFFLLIFYRQYYEVNYQTAEYLSDMKPHIRIGQHSKGIYSLMYFTLGLLDRLPLGGVWIAGFLTLFLLFGIFATWRMLRFLLPKQDKWITCIYAFICNMVFPITMYYFPYFGDFRYKGMLIFNVYHNSTYIGMKPFAILAVLFFFRIISTYPQKRISWKDWVGLAGSMLAATACKPNFVIGFAVAMLVVLIVDFIRVRGKKILNFILVGSTVFPAFLVTLYQKTTVYQSESSSQLKIGFMTALKAVVKNPEIPLLLSFVFPLVILVFVFKDLKTDKIYRFAWLHMIINLGMTLFLYESGRRLLHGNFFWGSYFAIGILFIVSIAKFDELITRKKTGWVVISSMALGAHILCWINYACNILKGAKPF